MLWSQDPAVRSLVIALIASNADARARMVGLLEDEVGSVKVASDPDELGLLSQAVDAAVVHADACTPEGVAAVAAVSAILAGVPLVLVTPDCERHAQRLAVDAGADGIVLEAGLERALGPTVRATMGGQTVVPRVMRWSFETPALSFREKQVLRLVALGCKNAEIGRRLFLAESTVKGHLSSSFDKLGVRSRREAATLIADERNGLGILDAGEGEPAPPVRA